MKNVQCNNEGKLSESHELGTQPLECGYCLQYLNDCKNLIEVRPDYQGVFDKDMNQAAAATAMFHFAEQYLDVAKMDLQQLFVWVKRMEGLTFQCSFMYYQATKKQGVNDPDVLKRKKGPTEFQAEVKRQQDNNRPSGEKKKMAKAESDFERAVNKIVEKVGLAREIAEDMVRNEFKKAGKMSLLPENLKG